VDQRKKKSSKKDTPAKEADDDEVEEESTSDKKGANKENRVILPEELHSALQQAIVGIPSGRPAPKKTPATPARKKKVPPAPAPTPAPSPARRSTRVKAHDETPASKSLYYQYQQIVKTSATGDSKPKSLYKQFRDIAGNGQQV
jgi:hypothetical protein